MSNIDEQLSALMDGEQSDINLILKNIQNDEVRNHWKNYHLIRDVMRNQVSRVDKFDVSLKISEAIANEPTVMAPGQLRRKVIINKAFFKQLGGMSIAATVTAVAILVVQQNAVLNNNQVDKIASSSPNSTLIVNKNNIQTVSTRNIELNKAVAAKLNSYLVNHNEYAVTSGLQGAIPYTRVVNFNPTIKIVRSINAK